MSDISESTIGVYFAAFITLSVVIYECGIWIAMSLHASIPSLNRWCLSESAIVG